MTGSGDRPSDDGWQVVVTTLHNRGDSRDGYEETVVASGHEDEARRVYADTVATAAESGFEQVLLRAHGADIDTWPRATGWTS